MIDLEPIHVGAAWLLRWSRHKLVSDWSEEHKGRYDEPALGLLPSGWFCETWSLLAFLYLRY